MTNFNRCSICAGHHSLLVNVTKQMKLLLTFKVFVATAYREKREELNSLIALYSSKDKN